MAGPVYGFGASATLRLEAIATLVQTCERLGYESFWLNVAGQLQGATRPAGGMRDAASEWLAVGVQHPVEMLAAALDATTDVKVGIGLSPIDVFPPHDLIRAVRARRWPEERGILGIAAGASGARCALRMRAALEALRAARLPLAIGAGGRGPLVLRASGELADGVCLAWLNPGGLAAALREIRAGAAAAGREAPQAWAYVRLGLGDGGEDRVRREMLNYARLPHHGDNRAAAARAEIVGAALARPSDLPAALAPYRGAIPVIRPVLASPGDLRAWETVARDLAPASIASSAAGAS